MAKPATPNGLHIIAPMGSTVILTQGECIFLKLDLEEVNMTICHFASFNPVFSNGLPLHVPQGFFLGVMFDHIHINMDDRYHDITHSDCSTANARTCRPIAFDGYYALEGQNYDPGDPHANWQPVLNQYGCASKTDPACIQVTSTNDETTTLS